MPKVLIDIDECDYRESKAAVEIGFCTDLQEAVTNGIVLDGLTNGKIIQKMFPNAKISVFETYVLVIGENYEFNLAYPLDWWNRKWGE